MHVLILGPWHHAGTLFRHTVALQQHKLPTIDFLETQENRGLILNRLQFILSYFF